MDDQNLVTSPPLPALAASSSTAKKSGSKWRTLFVAIILFFGSLLSAFWGGYYLRALAQPVNSDISQTSPSPSPTTPLVEEPESTSLFLPGKQYFDDTVLAFTEDFPPKILVATVTRQEAESGANQATRVSFFDGQNWSRKIKTQNNETAAIFTNEIVKSWQIDLDPSRVLKETVQGKISVDTNAIDFQTGLLLNNISVRSLPGYTKFMSNGLGNLNINGQSLQAKILYTRIYSNNAQEIQFYDTPFGLTTYWLAFWDREGNFYHLDSTQVDNPTEKYQTHQFGVKVDVQGSVTKTFQVSVTPVEGSSSVAYEIQLGAPINQTIRFNQGSSINKAPSNAYEWFMSEGTGEVDGSAPGYGVVEYIHH